MAEQTTDLGMQELFDTAKDIRQKMDAGAPSAPLLKQVLDLVQKCSDTLEDMAASHNSLVKSVSRMRAAQERQEAFSTGLVKSISFVIRALQTMDLPHASGPTAGGVKKSWLSTVSTRTADPDPASAISGADPQEMVKKGMLMQAVSKMFGPKGGREVLYNSTLASQMLMEGKLTKSEHRAWKTLGRLPDHVQIAS